ADPALHETHGRGDALSSLRPRGDRTLRRALRRTRRPRALRRAGPGAEVLPLLPGPAPRSAREPHGPAGRLRTVRGGRAVARPHPRARGSPPARPPRSLAG